MKTLGDLYAETERKPEAVEAYKAASDLTAALDPQNQGMHSMLQIALKDLGEDELAAQESDWLENYMKLQAEQSAGGYGNMGNFTVQ